MSDSAQPTLIDQVNTARAFQAVADEGIAVTVEVFARTGHGIDRVSLPRLLTGAGVLALIGFLSFKAGWLTPWFVAYGVAYLAFGLYHRIKCGRFGLNGTHTESIGFSMLCHWRPKLHAWPWTFYTWGEPFLLALGAIALCFLDPVLGLWLLLATASMRRGSVLLYKWDYQMRKELHNGGQSMEYYLGNGGWHPGAVNSPTMARRIG